MRTLAVFALAVVAGLGVIAWLSRRIGDTPERGSSPIAAQRERASEAPEPARSTRHTQAATIHPIPPRGSPSAVPDPTDPSLPTYDADKVIRANPGLFREQFAREPRDEPWATRREVMVQSFALARLREVDPAASMEIECHTAICKLNVNTKNQALDHWLGRYPLGACLAPTYAWTKDGDIYLVFDQATRDQDGMIEASERCEAEQHDAWLSAVKAGKGPHE